MAECKTSKTSVRRNALRLNIGLNGLNGLNARRPSTISTSTHALTRTLRSASVAPSRVINPKGRRSPFSPNHDRPPACIPRSSSFVVLAAAAALVIVCLCPSLSLNNTSSSLSQRLSTSSHVGPSPTTPLLVSVLFGFRFILVLLLLHCYEPKAR